MLAAGFVDERLAQWSPITLFSAAAVAFALWLVLSGLVTLATRQRLGDPGPTADRFGSGSLALANLLVNRVAVTPSAVSAVLLDLAARRTLSLDDVGDGRLLIRQFPQRSARREHGAAEELVLDLVRERSGDGTTVPVGELSFGAGPAAEAWWKTFSAAVLKEGVSAGLLRKRWPRFVQGAMALGLAIPALLLAAGIEADDAVKRLAGDTSESSELGGGFSVGAVAWLAILVFASSRLRSWVTTAKGSAELRTWLGLREFLADQPALAEEPPAAVVVRGRHLAAAVALGVGHEAAARLPIGPQRDDVAWVRRGGLWREVTIDYPGRRKRSVGPLGTLLWSLAKLGLAAAALGLYALLLTTFAGVLFDAVGDPEVPSLLRFGLPGVVIGVPSLVALMALGVGLRAAVDAVGSAADLGHTVTIEGEVLRMPFETNSDGQVVASGFVAVDDGRSVRLEGYYCPTLQVSQGQRVRLEVTPRLGFVKRADALAP